MSCFDKFKGPKWFKDNLCETGDVVGFGELEIQAQKDLSALFDTLRSGKRLADASTESLQKMARIKAFSVTKFSARLSTTRLNGQRNPSRNWEQCFRRINWRRVEPRQTFWIGLLKQKCLECCHRAPCAISVN